MLSRIPLIVVLGLSISALLLAPTLENAFACKSKNASVDIVSDDVDPYFLPAVFSPSELTIKKKTKVTWTNSDVYPHTVTSGDPFEDDVSSWEKLFNSGTLHPSDTFSHTFKKKGTYEYFCDIHPHMVGQVIVK